MASVMVQVPTPLSSSVDGAHETGPVGPETVQVIVPVGVTPGPETVALKTKVPPVTTPAAVSMTPVLLAALAMEAVVSWPELVS